jgi:RNA polymerase sigma factor (sigma-70 family)
MHMNDRELLHRFADRNDQAAFTDLVRQHIDLVFSTALRHVGGDTHRAQDVAQQVFIDLASKSRTLRNHPCLTGWLYSSTRFLALNAVRCEMRRAKREKDIDLMPAPSCAADANPGNVRAVIDDALQELDEDAREVILLRFFGNKPLATIGANIGLSEDAAQKKVARALDQLNTVFLRRGISSTATALAAAITQVGVAAPSSLAGSIVAAATRTPGFGGAVARRFFAKAPPSFAALGGLAVVAAFVGGQLIESKTGRQKLAEREAELQTAVTRAQTVAHAETRRADAAEADIAKLLKAVEAARTTSTSTPRRASAPAPKIVTFYTVLRGDTGAKIAASCHVTVEALRAANPTYDFSLMAVGDQVVIPPGGQPPWTPNAANASSPQGEKSTSGEGAYLVTTGDTGSKIAEKTGLTPEQITALNPSVNWAQLKVGQPIRIQ